LTAFLAHPPNLPPRPLMTVDFAVIRPLVQPGRPHIRFLSIGSRFCPHFLQTLPHDDLLALRRHQAGQRTSTSKLSNILGTRNYPPAKPGALRYESRASGLFSRLRGPARPHRRSASAPSECRQAALEQAPKKLIDFFDKSSLQRFDFERFLIVRTIPFERKAH
jgi:hypothetical protein